MLQHRPTIWRSNKVRLVVGIVCGFLFFQYIFGYSVYNITTLNYRYISASIYGSPNTAVKLNDVDSGAQEIVTTLSTTPTLISNFSTTTTIFSTTDTNVKWGNTSDSLQINGTDSTTVAVTVLSTSAIITADNVTMSPQPSTLEMCPVLPPVLVGPIRVYYDKPTMAEIEALNPKLEPGGHGKPENCTSRHKVAIIIPFRDRWEQLRVFLHNLHDLLTKQQLDYAIFIVEQIENQTFNRAKLMNVGFVEALRYYDWSCFIFHDVDLMPQDDRNIYGCPEQPRHMSVAIDKFNYKLPYTDIFGGITALTVEQFRKLNGFSNDFWGWGGEDDEIASRVKLAGFKISRYPHDIARYTMMKHSHEGTNPVNKCRYNLMYKVKQRWKKDGLTSLKYKVVKRQLQKLITVITVDLLEEESRLALDGERIC